MIKQSYFYQFDFAKVICLVTVCRIVLFDPKIGLYQMQSERTRKQWQWKPLHFSQSSRTWTSPSDCLVAYPGHSLEEFYPSAEMQSVYSTALANRATGHSSGDSHLSAEMQLVFYSPSSDIRRMVHQCTTDCP